MDISIDSTTNESDYSLFSIHQATRAFNVSRSTLIRLEEIRSHDVPEKSILTMQKAESIRIRDESVLDSEADTT